MPLPEKTRNIALASLGVAALIVILLLIRMALESKNAVVTLPRGALDPPTETWILDGGGPDVELAPGAADGWAYWTIADKGDGHAWYTRNLTERDLSHEGGWQVRVRAAVAEPPEGPGCAVGVQISDGRDRWSLCFGEDGLYHEGPQGPVLLAELDVRVFREYRLIYDPAAEVVSIAADNVVLKTLSRPDAADDTAGTIRFGSFSDPARSVSNWGLVEFVGKF